MNFIAQLPLCICRFIGLPRPQTPAWHLAAAHETHSCNYKTSSEKLPPPLSSGSGQQGAGCRLCMGLAGLAPAGSEAPSEHPGLDQFCPEPTPHCSSSLSCTSAGTSSCARLQAGAHGQGLFPPATVTEDFVVPENNMGGFSPTCYSC